MECHNCKAKSVCAAVVQPGSVICLMNRMRYCGTHAEEEPRRQQGDYCQYCGQRLREIGRERFCNNVNCQNRYVNVWGMPWILSLLSRGRPCTSLETHGGQEINSPQ